MCSVPVTFGGGSMIVYAGPWPDGLNRPFASHQEYHLVSKLVGSKLFSMVFKAGTRRRRARRIGRAARFKGLGQSLAKQGFGGTLVSVARSPREARFPSPTGRGAGERVRRSEAGHAAAEV